MPRSRPPRGAQHCCAPPPGPRPRLVRPASLETMEAAAPPPVEFTEEYVKEHRCVRIPVCAQVSWRRLPLPRLTHRCLSPRRSAADEQLFAELLLSGEPYKSLGQHHVHMGAKYGYSNNPFNKDGTLRGDPETPGLDLNDDDLYYNTMGSAAEYWAGYDLPKPTKDIHQLRADLKDWGYCLIEDGLSAEQLARMQKRTQDQLDGERMAGVAAWAAGQPGGNQFIHGILNKDPEGQFAQCMSHDPRGAQGANMVEQLVTETIGEGFIGSSFLGVIAYQNCQPQGLHQDQGVLHCGGVQSAPWSMNTMYVLDDFTAENGWVLAPPPALWQLALTALSCHD